MFCKWCGGNLVSSDTKCKRCGKEIPALSDCGGFYDLVSSAKKTAEVHTGPVVLPESPVDSLCKPEPPIEVSTPKNQQSKNKSLLGLTAMIAVDFVIILLLLGVALGKINQYSSKVNELRNDLRIIEEKINALQMSTEPETTEPVIVGVPVLAEQNIIFTAKIPSRDSPQKMDADLNLGNYIDVAIITYGLDTLTGTINSAGYSLIEANTTVSLTIDRNIEFRSRTVSVSYVIDDTVYGLSKAPEIFKWQYRFDAESDWVDFPRDTFDQTDITGKTRLNISDRSLQELFTDNKGQLELRCEICRNNTDGGSLTIVVEGIRFYDEENNEEQTAG